MRTFFTFTIVARAMIAAQRAPRPAYRFEGTKPPEFFESQTAIAHSSRVYRNPSALVWEWHGMLASRGYATRADLARQLGVTRARVTQVLGHLDLVPREFSQG